ncbi:hypothetical protein J2128_001275 [Methanomicrobium sp. W14]|nr:hypothetical protein [Methanomicrobium sp. W14]
MALSPQNILVLMRIAGFFTLAAGVIAFIVLILG